MVWSPWAISEHLGATGGDPGPNLIKSSLTMFGVFGAILEPSCTLSAVPLTQSILISNWSNSPTQQPSTNPNARTKMSARRIADVYTRSVISQTGWRAIFVETLASAFGYTLTRSMCACLQVHSWKYADALFLPMRLGALVSARWRATG